MQGFGAGAAAGAQPGDHGAAGEGADLGEVTFPDVDDFDVRYVHGYGKVANVEAGMVFLEDRSGFLHWKIFWGISVRPLGAKTAGGREAAGDAVTLLCPFWVTQEGARGESVPRSLPVHAAPQLPRGPSRAPRTSWARWRK